MEIHDTRDLVTGGVKNSHSFSGLNQDVKMTKLVEKCPFLALFLTLLDHNQVQSPSKLAQEYITSSFFKDSLNYFQEVRYVKNDQNFL